MAPGENGAGRSGRALGAALLLACSFACSTARNNDHSLVGAVLEAANDPRRQRPMANARIRLTSKEGTVETSSDATGSFRLQVTARQRQEPGLVLRVEHAGYKPETMEGPLADRIYVVRLQPLPLGRTVAQGGKEVAIRDLRVRYSVKVAATFDVGSFVRTFEVAGSGGVACAANATCSPDGRWQAAAGSAAYDAGDGNEFHDVRVSCIAGPCGFASAQPAAFSGANRRMKITALNWAQRTTFLVEAEVTRKQIDDAVRYSIPVVFGSGMEFTLPGSAEGPSVEAEVNGSEIVFPLGPSLLLDWAQCSVKTDAAGSKLYRCELKPGYIFQ